MVQRGLVEIAPPASSAAVPGAAGLSTSAWPSATGPLRMTGITPWTSGSAGRLLFLEVCSGRGPGCPGPPAQIPACGFPAPGSCQRSNAIEVRDFGGPCTPNPQARSFGYTPYPALSPGRALLLAFPPAGRLPSTISATDLWSLCSRLHRYCAAVRLLTPPATASPPRLPIAARLRHSGLGEVRSPRFRCGSLHT